MKIIARTTLKCADKQFHDVFILREDLSGFVVDMETLERTEIFARPDMLSGGYVLCLAEDEGAEIRCGREGEAEDEDDEDDDASNLSAHGRGETEIGRLDKIDETYKIKLTILDETTSSLLCDFSDEITSQLGFSGQPAKPDRKSKYK